MTEELKPLENGGGPGTESDDFYAGMAGTVETVLLELAQAGGLRRGQLLVIGTSTSEVLGYRIGTQGTERVAREIFEGVRRAREQTGFYPVFQCCEHLNRALVMEREALALYPLLEPVSVVPVPKAGGSMAAYAYRTFKDPVVVEAVRAHAGLDIGGTLIGMHLRPVAVPVRPSVRMLGHAHLQMAYTRPKLIGGERAVYSAVTRQEDGNCD
ncbi:TIGR01440 family protein [Paenibacillus mesotrionivorans]|uniref:TIGR01440 family protein n=1 Tax=Paenibacillus mesotrionivorans TaxID=3160968 RepID=A0ACC7P8Q7_9BACL